MSSALIGVKFDDLKAFARDVKAAGRDINRDFRAGMKAAGEIVAEEARSRASWSSRIPATIKVQVRVGVVEVVAGGPSAPHAPLYELGGSGGGPTFRHPVFGNRQVWVDQATRPFLLPAFEDKAREVTGRVEHVIDETARRAGFH